MSKGFDLSSAAPVADAEDEGQTFHVHDEHGDPLYYADQKPVTMTMAGTYSRRYRRAEEAMTNRRLKRRRRSLSAEEVRRDQLHLTASCALDWEGFFQGGTPIECTKDNAVKVLEVAPWIRDQAEQVMEDHAGFLQSSSKG